MVKSKAALKEADVIDTIRKKYGDGAIMTFGAGPVERVATVSTGSLCLNAATGVGGWPRGRIVEVFGPASTGKTTLCLHAIAEAQKEKITAAFVDAEHSFDPSYAKVIGIDLKTMLFSQPDYGEQALGIVEELVRADAGLVVVDSVAALIPKNELDGDIGDVHMGLQARMMSQTLRKLTGIASKKKTCVIFVNQTRDKIGVLFGSPEVTSGGNALKFYSSMRFRVSRAGVLKKGDVSIGIQTSVKIVKNKLAPPFRDATFDVIYGQGIDALGEIFDLAIERGIIEKAGAWFSIDGERLGHGRANAIQFLREREKLVASITNGIGEV